MTLSFGNDRRVLRDAAGNLAATVGTDDLGTRSQKALRDLGFAVKVDEEPLPDFQEAPIREKSLATLEANLWDTLFAWVDTVAFQEKPKKTKRIKLAEFV